MGAVLCLIPFVILILGLAIVKFYMRKEIAASRAEMLRLKAQRDLLQDLQDHMSERQ